MSDFLRGSAEIGFIVQGMGDLFVAVGDRAPSAGAVVWLEREAGQFADAHAGRALYMHVTREQAGFGMPDDDSRRAMNNFVKRAGVKFTASAVVVAQEGFVGSALRSVFSGVLLAVRIPTPTKIFAEAGEGHTWLRTTSPGSRLPPVEHLLAEISRMVAGDSSPAASSGAGGGFGSAPFA